MKAVQVIGYGDAVENLELRDIPEPPPPGDGELLIGVEFAPINFNDLLVPWGYYPWKPEPPATIGNEGAGIVLAVGSSVAKVKVGDRVVLPPTVRSYQQRLLVREADVVLVPPDADPKQAAMMQINAVTASLLLSEYVDLQPGDAVAFNSATSGLSRWLIALARKRGIKTVGLVRRTADIEKVMALGCDAVIADDEDLAVARERIAGLNVRLGLEALGGTFAARLLEVLSAQAVMVTYGSVTLTPMHISAGILIGLDVTVRGYFEGHPEMAPKVKPTLERIVGMLSGPNPVTQPIVATYPIEQIKEAVALAVQGKKVMLEIGGASGR